MISFKFFCIIFVFFCFFWDTMRVGVEKFFFKISFSFASYVTQQGKGRMLAWFGGRIGKLVHINIMSPLIIFWGGTRKETKLPLNYWLLLLILPLYFPYSLFTLTPTPSFFFLRFCQFRGNQGNNGKMLKNLWCSSVTFISSEW